MIFGLRTCTSSDARFLDAACGRTALALPLGTFLPQFIMGAVKELYASLEGESSPVSLPIQWAEETPFDHPGSRCRFQVGPDKPFVATRAAIEMYGAAIFRCLRELQKASSERGGLDYLQVFVAPSKPESLWIIEDSTITARLPSDH